MSILCTLAIALSKGRSWTYRLDSQVDNQVIEVLVGEILQKTIADSVAASRVLRRRRGAEPEDIMGQVHPEGRYIQRVGASRGRPVRRQVHPGGRCIQNANPEVHPEGRKIRRQRDEGKRKLQLNTW
jgi:hypothetical protein